MLICKFCRKECKNPNSFRNHERTCPVNEDRVYKNGMTGKIGSNQYKKASSLGLPKQPVSVSTSKKLSDAIRNRTDKWNKENGKKISKTVNEKVADGTWHTSLARNMHIDYNGIDLHGSWELAYAKFLDANTVKWVRCSDSFLYTFAGKDRRYTPDFYLVESDEYVEIKGYKTEKDAAKWAQFPPHRKLKVLLGKDLKQLGII